MSAPKLSRGDVVLVRFPFTDLAGTKLRPAVVVSPGGIGQDVILAAVSSAIPKAVLPTDPLVEDTAPEFPRSGLRRTSIIRLHKLVTLEQRLVVRRLGRIGDNLQGEVDKRLRLSLGV